MKKRLAFTVAGLAVTVAAAIPASSAFGFSESHCSKLNNALNTASTSVGNTNSGQASNVQSYLGNAAGKCALC